MTRQPWTAEEVALLRQLSREGVALRIIAERLGRKYKATALYALRVGVQSPKQRAWSTVEIRRARAMYDGGMKRAEIAERLGRTPSSVARTLSRHGGLETERKRRGMIRDDATAYSLWARGLMCSEILLVLGRPSSATARRTLCSYLHRYAARARLPVPPQHGRHRVDYARVEAERRRMYGDAVRPLNLA